MAVKAKLMSCSNFTSSTKQAQYKIGGGIDVAHLSLTIRVGGVLVYNETPTVLTGTAYTYFGTSGLGNTLKNALPTSTSGTATWTLSSYTADYALIGTDTCTSTASIPAVYPTLNLTAGGSAPTGRVTNTSRNYAVAVSGSTINASRTFTRDTGTTGSVTNYWLDNANLKSNAGNDTSWPANGLSAGNHTVKCTITDSRGLATTKTATVAVTDYTAPTCTLPAANVYRENSGSTKLVIKPVCNVNKVLSGSTTTNRYKVYIQVREAGKTWSLAHTSAARTPTGSDQTYTWTSDASYALDKAWEVRAYVEDDFIETSWTTIQKAEAANASTLSGVSDLYSNLTGYSFTITRRQAGVTHTLVVKAGDKTVHTYQDNSGVTGTVSVSLSGTALTDVRNAILDSMYSTTSTTLTYTLTTKDGGTTLGTSTLTKTAYVHEDVVPTVSSQLTVTQSTPAGTFNAARAYCVQGVTGTIARAETSFTAPRGTDMRYTASSLRPTNSTGTDWNDAVAKSGSQFSTGTTISHDFTYTPPIAGWMKVRVDGKDWRLRSKSPTDVNFYVVPYTPPTLTASAARINPPDMTTVRLTCKVNVATITPSGGTASNSFKVEARRRTVGGSYPAWGNANNKSQSFTKQGATNKIVTLDFTGNSILTAYEFEVRLQDDFGSKLASANITTEKVPFAISNDGIGAGKIPEAGRALDVGGDMYVSGDIFNENVPVTMIKTVNIPASVLEYGVNSSTVRVYHNLGYVPKIVVINKVTRLGAGIMMDLAALNSTYVDVFFSRYSSFGAHSNTIALQFYGIGGTVIS